MKLVKTRKLFSSFDSKLGVWSPPFCFDYVGEAERFWESVVKDPNSAPAKHPDDYRVYMIGEMDEDTGLITPVPAVHVCDSVQFVDRKASA